MSLKAALETLGFGPCYHMIEVWDGLLESYDAAQMRRRIRAVQALSLAVPAVLALLATVALVLLGRRARR